MAAGTFLRLRLTWAISASWLIAALLGFAIMIDRDVTPGEDATPPATYPGEMFRPAATDRPTLVMFAHPRCPCTRASLDELRQILQACPGAADVFIYFRTPATSSPDWTRTALWEEAATLPDTTLVADTDGAVARHCGVETSGHVLLYGTDGRLLFSGGITAARGHVGESVGGSAIVAILAGRPEVAGQSATFGCPLFDPTARAPEETCSLP